MDTVLGTNEQIVKCKRSIDAYYTSVDVLDSAILVSVLGIRSVLHAGCSVVETIVPGDYNRIDSSS